MSVEPITGVSLYHYYYKINEVKETEEAEKNKAADETEEETSATEETDPNERPWATLMQQLGLPYNEDPKDDIADIKHALNTLIFGMDDNELLQDVQDLIKYVEQLYNQNYSEYN